MGRWIAVAVLALLPAFAAAHEVPADVRLQVYVHPHAGELEMLVRVPLAAMREVDVPTRGAGYVDLARVDGALREAAALWIADNLAVRAAGRDLGPGRITDVRVSLSSDRSFESYESALARLHAPPLDAATNLSWNQQYLDARLAWPLADSAARIAIHPSFGKLALRVATTLRYRPPTGAERAFELHGDPGWVTLDPGWGQAAWEFTKLGFLHILGGTDHLLFIACLVIPFRRLRALVLIATAFTVAHSITLAAAAMGHAPDALWFPPLVEMLIAVSIFWLAIENVFGAALGRRWAVAFAFGLVHGFGFAFGLRESLQFAGDHLATALVFFNAGVEIGQVAVLLVLVPVLDYAFRRVHERTGVVVLSALVAHTAWHWMDERWQVLAKWPVPKLEPAVLMQLAAWIVLAAFALWLGRRFAHRPGRDHRGASTSLQANPHPPPSSATASTSSLDPLRNGR